MEPEHTALTSSCQDRNTTTFIIPGEVFPTRYRSTAHGISAASGKFGAIIAQIMAFKLRVLSSLPRLELSADRAFPLLLPFRPRHWAYYTITTSLPLYSPAPARHNLLCLRTRHRQEGPRRLEPLGPSRHPDLRPVHAPRPHRLDLGDSGDEGQVARGALRRRPGQLPPARRRRSRRPRSCLGSHHSFFYNRSVPLLLPISSCRGVVLCSFVLFWTSRVTFGLITFAPSAKRSFQRLFRAHSSWICLWERCAAYRILPRARGREKSPLCSAKSLALPRSRQSTSRWTLCSQWQME